jgi:GntR family transcriptional regulator, histidine utilization repressor
MSTAHLPAYERVKAFVKRQISTGAWRPGDPVPSEAALLQQFGISRMTANRAMKELAVEGLVTRVQGSGTVVAQLHRISTTLALRDIHEDIAERGHQHATRVLALETTRADAALAHVFKLRSGARLFHSVLLHLEDGVPIQLEDRHVNPAAAPEYMSANFKVMTPTAYLLQHAPLTEASYSIEAGLASNEEARHMGIKRGDPCLVMTRSTMSGPHVASFARLVHPGARYSFSGKFQL